MTLCFPLEGDIRVLVLTPLALLEHVPAVVQVDVDEPLVQPLQGVLLEVPVGLVVPTPGDEGLSYYAPLWQRPKILVVPVGIFSYFLYLLVPGAELLLETPASTPGCTRP